MSHYDTNLDKNNANYVPLTPLTFLKRAKEIYPNYEAVIYEDRKYSWDQVYKRTVKFASALNKIGVKKGDTVSVLAFNTPEIFEGHYSVPMTGVILNTINITSTNTQNNIIEVQAFPESNDVVGLKDLYLNFDVSKSTINMFKDVIASGEDVSGVVFTRDYYTSSYSNGDLERK